jgi:hypothetical protein
VAYLLVIYSFEKTIKPMSQIKNKNISYLESIQAKKKGFWKNAFMDLDFKYIKSGSI